MVAEGERRTDGSWVWLISGFFRERDKGLLFLSFFFSLSRWQLGFGIMGLGFFCVYAFWKRMWEQNFGPLLIFLVWDSHLFIGKIICLFPPHCLVPKTLWSLIFFLCTLVPSSKYFLLFFWKMLEKSNVDSMKKINDFENGALKVERVEKKLKI